jgi:two-component system phosphate regulon sensor histidine kinase PhoR
MISAWWLLAIPFLLALLLRLGKRHKRMHYKLWQVESDLAAMNEKLKQRSDHLDAIFATVNEAIVRLDAEGNVLSLNPQARRVFRLPRHLSMPQPMPVLYRSTKWNKALRRALAQMPEPFDIPDINIHEHVLAIRLAPLGESEALLLCLDVSHQHELEAQRDQLVRDLMHDMKTPLTSILGYARSIESFGDNKELRKEAVQTIVQESKRLNQLLESLLTLDTLSQGLPIEDAKCDAAQVARELEQLLKPVAKRVSVKLKVTVHGDCEHFPMDGGDLYRVLINVVENAIRYTPVGSTVTLDVRCDGNEAMFSVVDEGPGIDSRHLPHVTERFYRAEDDRGRQVGEQSGGHGMGLAIVQETINRYSGRLQLANLPQGGLEVRVQLPIAQK